MPLPLSAGHGAIVARRSGPRTVLSTAFAASPLRLLTPRNHGHAAWIYLATLGGGLVNGDRLDVRLEVGEGASALLGTQASTKVYRSPRGCSQSLDIAIAPGASVAVVPDPVVCFAGARYTQDTRVSMTGDGSLVLLDGYTCGRRARGERWEFDAFAARTTIVRDGRTMLIDATRLDPRHGPIARRMGRFDALLTLLAVGPRCAPVCRAILRTGSSPPGDPRTVVAASPVGSDAAILRVASERFENASLALRPCFSELARILGDDPFARKW